MRPPDPSEPPPTSDTGSLRRRSSTPASDGLLGATPSRTNEYPPDPDAVLYHGSYVSLGFADAPVSSEGAIFDEDRADVPQSSPDVESAPNGVAAYSLEVHIEEDEDEEDEEEHKATAKATGNLLRGKAAARLPHRAAAMASRARDRETVPLLAAMFAPDSQEGGYQAVANSVYEQEYEVDEDTSIRISGYHWSRSRSFLYKALCFATAGLFWLLCRWFPRWELKMTMARCPLSVASNVAVENQWKQLQVLPVKRKPFGGSLADAFERTGVTKAGDALGAESGKAPDMRNIALPFLISFEYRYVRFMFNPLTGLYQPNQYWRDYRWHSVDKALAGIDGEKIVRERRTMFGENAVEIEEKPVFRLLMDEVLHPFYIFQVASIILWSLDDYYYYAACIFLISTSSAIATLVETRETMRRMREMSRFSCEVRVYRDHHWSVVNSEDIVPGDIFEVTPGMLSVFPCDGVLLSGDCIVNESMLTGESVPVSKSPIKDIELRAMDLWEEDPASSSRMSRFFLFAGTKIIRARGGNRSAASTPRGSDTDLSSSSGALALAVRTGFNTTKGSLVRSMLFPKPNSFKFYRDSFRFIGVLAIIAGFGFLGSVYNFIVLKVALGMIIVRALDLITIVVPPALPATMAIGTSFAIGRLRQGDIYCTSPPRVNICGKLDLIAFDKTGTLTEEGLDVLGFRYTIPAGTEVLEELFGEKASFDGQLRFTSLYKDVDETIPSGALDRSKSGEQSQDLEWFPEGLNDQDGIAQRLRNPASMSIRLGTLPGHPNGTEPDFPYPLIVCAMATCHSLKIVDGMLIGDPMDVKMFEFTGWHIEEGGQAVAPKTANAARNLERRSSANDCHVLVSPPDVVEFGRRSLGPHEARKSEQKAFTELGVVRVFEFASNLRRMAVVVRRVRHGDENERPANGVHSSHEVFVKGAPEVMRSICRPGTLPKDYERQLNDYAHHGYRVIACAHRQFDGDYKQVMKTKRDQMEFDLNFLGFIVFENKLKPGTARVVDALNQARIRQVMCTGDNVLTAISVSRECELVDPQEKTFAARFLPGAPPTSEEAEIVWEDVDGSGATLDSETLLPNLPPQNYGGRYSYATEEFESFPHKMDDDAASSNRSDDEYLLDVNSIVAKVGEYNLAVTGDVFQWMLEFGSDASFNRMLLKGQIYARMSPDQKHFLVENFEELGYCVGFCGDGANDCGALKAADVGLSLSEAEASVAAPFTSRSTDLDCVLRIIREGRAALVTSFSCFKYMALYSLIQFTSVSLLYSLAGNLGDFQFLYIDLALIIPIAVFMGRSKAFPQIFKKGPTASLVSRKVLASLMFQLLVQSSFQFWVFTWVRRQPWYEPSQGTVDERIYKGYENTVVFLLSCFQYIAVAVALCTGKPYRQPMWKNGFFVTTIAVLTAISLYLTYSPTPAIRDILDLVDLPDQGKDYILVLALIDWFLTWTGEHWFVPWIVKGLKAFSIARRAAAVAARPGSLGGGSGVVTATRTARREEKQDRWKSKGKVFKLVKDEMRRQAHGLDDTGTTPIR
ncbi:hypothetical protein HDU85_007542 [Gaertneriomyces sp. JEL0708]|nr:hypothetical protein HDU85_007542 [Gaertneriomyces sp. JEL0708]